MTTHDGVYHPSNPGKMMFVADQHINLVRFLWWENGDVNEQPQHYHMNVHIFGGISSPSCSNYVLPRTARDQEQKYEKEVADTLRGISMLMIS